MSITGACATGSQVTRTINGQTFTLAYDAENRMVSVSGPSMNASFVYDGNGKRVKSVINGVGMVFVGDYYELAGGAVSKYYFLGGARVAMRQGGALYYPLTDHLGSTSVTTDSLGNAVAELRYKPWGETRLAGGTTASKYQFSGQYSNVPEFGLYYYNARWYDPYLKQFTSPDSLIPDPYNSLDYNRYSYSRYNPVKYTDPSGHKPAQDSKDPPTPENKGLCIKDVGCSETLDWNLNWIKWNLLHAPKYDLDKLPSDLSATLENLNWVGEFGTSTYENWTGQKIKGAGKIGFGFDAVIQLISDAPRDDLTYEDRITRAGINGVEGLAVGEISTIVATHATELIVNPSLTIAVDTGQAWVVPATVAGTWISTYVVTNIAFTWLSNQANSVIMPGGN